MALISCQKCGKPYPETGIPFCCSNCGGLFDWEQFPDFDKTRIDPTKNGLWRYRSCLGLADDAPLVTLGEGGTPLIEDDFFGKRIAFKLECLNPTGSYKDRGSAVLLSWLSHRGVTSAVEDSSGNAGASFSAYAGRVGVSARIFVPGFASGPKLRQIEAYGAELIIIDGPRSAATQAVLKEADQGSVYASHAYLPFGMAGIATIAYELFEQMGTVPGTVIAPVGHGSLLLGIMRGFAALKRASCILKLPQFVGVQARACAPVWAQFTHQVNEIYEGNTLAEGVRVRYPLRANALIDEADKANDLILAVNEERILPCRNKLAHRGVYVEPTSALVWAALEDCFPQLTGPIVLVMSGSGLKYNM